MERVVILGAAVETFKKAPVQLSVPSVTILLRTIRYTIALQWDSVV